VTVELTLAELDYIDDARTEAAMTFDVKYEEAKNDPDFTPTEYLEEIIKLRDEQRPTFELQKLPFVTIAMRQLARKRPDIPDDADLVSPDDIPAFMNEIEQLIVQQIKGEDSDST
jgi:hypothetical protein